MATKSIEERAKQYVFDHKRCGKTFYGAYVLGAQDQDRIARQDERERCINEAMKILVDMRLILDSHGFTADEFRKRMMQGGEG